MKRIVLIIGLLCVLVGANAQYRDRVSDRLWQYVPPKGLVMIADDYIDVYRGCKFHKAITDKETHKVKSFSQMCYFAEEKPDSFDVKKWTANYNLRSKNRSQKEAKGSDGRFIVCKSDAGMVYYEITSLTDSTMTLRQDDGMVLNYRLAVDSLSMDKEYRRSQRKGMVEAVKFIYQFITPMYYSDTAWDKERWLEMFCTPSLQRQQQLISDWEDKTSDLVIDYDYWIGAQDYEHPVVKVVGSKARTDSTGTVRISITEENMTPKVRYMRLEMKREKGVWLINDFKNEDDGKIYSLRKVSREFLREQYSEALERDRKEHPINHQAEIVDSKGRKVKVIKSYRKGETIPSKVDVVK